MYSYVHGGGAASSTCTSMRRIRANAAPAVASAGGRAIRAENMRRSAAASADAAAGTCMSTWSRLDCPHTHRTCTCRWSSSTTTKTKTKSSNTATTSTDAEALHDGAWQLLAALEKAREAEGVRVSRLVSSLEVLLPRPAPGVDLQDTDSSAILGGGPTSDTAAQHLPNLSTSGHTSDPAFFRLPDPTQPTRNDIASMLRSTRRGRRIDLSTIESLLRAATQHYRQRPSIVTLPPLANKDKIHVVGDLHASLSDCEAVLGLTGEPSPTNRIVYNGDLADRGDNGVEVIATVCALSLAYPDAVTVNRGNHEDIALSVAYGLYSEIQYKYGGSVFRDRLSSLLDEFFMSLPLATVVEDDVFVVHGGPPPPGIDLKMIRDTVRWDGCGVSRTIRTHADYKGIDWESARSSGSGSGSSEHFESLCEQDHAVEEIVEAMVWSDPEFDEFDGSLLNSSFASTTPNLSKWNDTSASAAAVWSPNVSRGAGHRFDANIIRQFLISSGLKRLVRSHEPVQKGCARYEIAPFDTNKASDNVGNDAGNDRPLEFFTVFSASRYPYKQGFNHGAILTLMPGYRHRIVRYATDDDDPLLSFEDLLKRDEMKLVAKVDAIALRRSLRAAIATRRVAFEKELKDLSIWLGEDIDSLPFEDTIDALFRTLNLRGEGLLQEAPRRALALALEPDLAPDERPMSINILDTLDKFAAEDREADDCTDYGQNNSWLQAIFALIDVSHEGWISREEWNAAVKKVNANLPPGAEPIDGDEMWQILDQNGDGRLSHWEWNALGSVMCR